MPRLPGCGMRRSAPMPVWSRPRRIGCASPHDCAAGSRCSRSRSTGTTKRPWRIWLAMSCPNPPLDTRLDTPDAQPAADASVAPIPWSDRVEAGGAALFFAAMGALPIDAASAVGGALARQIGPWLGISKRARRNLSAALPELSAGETERVLRGMWDNLGRVTAEYPHLPRIRVFPPDGRVETSGVEHLDRAIAGGRAVIIFGGHLGNWEIAALAAGQYGIDVA